MMTRFLGWGIPIWSIAIFSKCGMDISFYRGR
jgi:hypothetical protein